MAIALGGFGLFLASIDFAINVSLPIIRDSFQTNLVNVQWIIIAYHVSRSSLGFAAGGIADRFGLRDLFLVGVGFYTIAVGLISLQSELHGVVVLRALQGVGAGILFTAAPALVTRAFKPSKRGTALGITLAAVALGQIAGTLGGGWLSSNLGWESIFWSRVPIGAAIFAIALIALKPTRPPEVTAVSRTEPINFDWLGAAMLAVTLLFLLLAIAFARFSGWYSTLPVVLSSLGLLGLVGFMAWELRADRPIIPAALLRIPEFRAGAISNLLVTIASFVMWFLFPFYVVDVLHRGSVALGTLLSIMAAAGFAGSVVGGWFADRIGDRTTTISGSFILAFGLIWVANLGSGAFFIVVGASVALLGLGFGIHQAAVYALTMRKIPIQHAGSSSAMLAVTQTVGTVCSITLMTSILNWRHQTALGSNGDEISAFVTAFHDTYLIAASVALVAALVVVHKFRYR